MEQCLTRKDAYWILNSIRSVGPITLNRLLEFANGDPVAALEASRGELRSIKGITTKSVDSILNWASEFDLEKEKRKTESLGAIFVSRECARYPRLLKEINDPPIGFYCLGDYEFKKPSVAIIGSRRTTLYGQGVAKEFGQELARRGYCVTSGMARGIDSLAHHGALNVEGGSTVAVLGCGADIIYPPENIDLYRDIQRKGAVISEFPLGRKADRQTFPMRNRLVSGMSEAVIVVESDAKGGSLITAKFAADQGRLVCAIPGRIDQRTSSGCNELIRDGAVLLTSVDDLLAELEYEARAAELPLEASAGVPIARPDLTEEEASLAKCFEGGEALDVDRLCGLTGKSVGEVSSGVMMLELKGVLAKRLDGLYEAT
ncbi:MAG: DNA-processing protein DprA [Verrucomicrobiota bacterium]